LGSLHDGAVCSNNGTKVHNPLVMTRVAHTVEGMNQPPRHRRASHPNPFVQLLPEIEVLSGIEAMFSLDGGAAYEDVRLDLVAIALDALGPHSTGSDLLKAWVETYLSEVIWIRVPWTGRSDPLLWIAPCKTIHLLSGGWIHVEMELEFERASDNLYLPQVREALPEFLLPPTPELFEVADDPDDPFRPC